MELSIIIVSYNVCDCLQACTDSLQIATQNIESELIVIDNNSSDDSPTFLQETLSNKPNTSIILNNENLGYAKACNQGIREAKGKFILLINPDTIVPPDCLKTVLSFMNITEHAGACGVKMYNAKGEYLKESKRGMPSLWNSFCKFSGLCNLFPKSKLLAGYYLGHLSEKQNAEIDVLTGAFMMIRLDILQKVGLFDEDYFMYAEDIDLSIRIKQNGYQNFFIADTSITHLKGESTRRSQLQKNFHFYNAMKIFVRKHYKRSVYRFILKMLITYASYIKPAKI